MALLPVTPERQAFATALGRAVAAVIEEHPGIPIVEVIAIQAQIIGRAIAAAFGPTDQRYMLELVMRNAALQMEKAQ